MYENPIWTFPFPEMLALKRSKALPRLFRMFLWLILYVEVNGFNFLQFQLK